MSNYIIQRKRRKPLDFETILGLGLITVSVLGLISIFVFAINTVS